MAYKDCKVTTHVKTTKRRTRKISELNKPEGLCPKCGRKMIVEAIETGKFKGERWYKWRKTCTSKRCGYVWESKRYSLTEYRYE